ncbi:hypothetical protein VTO42DRAFT_5084 [Malbranchea cinnamomea]
MSLMFIVSGCLQSLLTPAGITRFPIWVKLVEAPYIPPSSPPPGRPLFPCSSSINITKCCTSFVPLCSYHSRESPSLEPYLSLCAQSPLDFTTNPSDNGKS